MSLTGYDRVFEEDKGSREEVTGWMLWNRRKKQRSRT